MLLIDFENDFAELLNEYPVTRYEQGADNDEGEWVAGGTVDTTVKATPTQPLSGEEEKLVQPEDGQYIADFRKIYCTSALQQRQNGIDPDDITIDGTVYQVYRASPRMELGGHFKAIIRKKQGDSQA